MCMPARLAAISVPGDGLQQVDKWLIFVDPLQNCSVNPGCSRARVSADFRRPTRWGGGSGLPCLLAPDALPRVFGVFLLLASLPTCDLLSGVLLWVLLAMLLGPSWERTCCLGWGPSGTESWWEVVSQMALWRIGAFGGPPWRGRPSMLDGVEVFPERLKFFLPSIPV